MKNSDSHSPHPTKLLLSFVGMPGAGKTEAMSYLQSKGFERVYFGQITIDYLKEHHEPVTPENERRVREQIRKELGMGAYAIKSKPRIDALLEQNDVVLLDSIYSWEEYAYLSPLYTVLLVHIYAEPETRYQRLAKRSNRPLTHKEAKERDKAEIEKINKGGPIAMADHLIDNDSEDIDHLHEKIDILMEKLGITAKL